MKISDTKKSILLYDVLLFIFATCFTMLIPTFLNYPPNSYNTKFETTIDAGLYYNVQAFFIILIAFVISNFYFIKSIRSIDAYEKYVDKDDEESKKQIEQIKHNCFKMPVKIYLVHAIVPSLSIIFILILTGALPALAYRIGLLLFGFFLLYGIIAFIFAKNMSNKVLQALDNQKKYSGKFKYTFTEKIFFLFFPLILSSIIFTTFAGGSVLKNVVGENMYANYNNKLETIVAKDSYNSIEEIVNVLYKVDKINPQDVYFIIKPLNSKVGDEQLEQKIRDSILFIDDKFETGIDEFFLKYTFNVSSNGHTYGYYASGKQGVFLNATLDGQPIAYGILYRVDTGDAFAILVKTAFVLFFISLLFLFYFSKDIGDQISEISENMNNIANEKNVNYDKKMAVISNDELGDLSISFNKILDLEKAHNDQMMHNQEILGELERLSSLG